MLECQEVQRSRQRLPGKGGKGSDGIDLWRVEEWNVSTETEFRDLMMTSDFEPG